VGHIAIATFATVVNPALVTPTMKMASERTQRRLPLCCWCQSFRILPRFRYEDF